MGADTDVWDEALGGGQEKLGSKKGMRARVDTEGAEAGKVWDRGRNWTTVVVEIVCARIGEGGQEQKSNLPGEREAGEEEDEEQELQEDEDVLEIPVFVRSEWEVDVAGDEAGGKEGKEAREKRELNYWCVLGVGRIAKSAV